MLPGARWSRQSYTFARMIEAWADARQGDRRPSYIREAVACLKRNLPSWQDRTASGITLERVGACAGRTEGPKRHRRG